MSATIALVRIQLHALFWPAVSVLAAFLLALLLPTPPTLAIVVCAAVVGSWLSGALVFGIEYMEGARDYIATRPVTSRRVLSIKVVCLLTCVIASFLAVTSLTAIPNFGPFGEDSFCLFFILLIFSLSSAVFTVLFQELVRGILASAVFLYALYLIWIGCDEGVFINEVKQLPYGSVETYPDRLISLYTAIFLMLSPFALLGSLIIIYQSRAAHRLRLPLFSILLLGTFSCSFLFITYCRWTEGESEFYSLGSLFDQSWHVKGSELTWVNFDHDKVSINRMILDEPTNISSFAFYLPGTYNNMLGAHLCGDIATVATKNLGQDRRAPWTYSLYAYRITNSSSVELIYSQEACSLSIDVCSKKAFVRINDGENYVFSCVDGTISPYVKPPDGRKGESSSLGPSPLENVERYNSNNSIRCAYDDQWQVFLDPPDKNVSGGSRLHKTAVDAKCIAVGGPLGATEEITRIPVPARFFNAPYRFAKVLRSSGAQGRWLHDSVLDSDELSLSVGGGYICLWHGGLGRVAVWRIGTAFSPKFIGIAVIPKFNILIAGLAGPDPCCLSFFGNTAPYVRPDGALGFMIEGQGILWLKFPALMKEAKS